MHYVIDLKWVAGFIDDNWLKLTTEFGKLFHGPVGTLQELTDYCEHLEKRRRHFATSCQHFNSN